MTPLKKQVWRNPTEQHVLEKAKDEASISFFAWNQINTEVRFIVGDNAIVDELWNQIAVDYHWNLMS